MQKTSTKTKDFVREVWQVWREKVTGSFSAPFQLLAFAVVLIVIQFALPESYGTSVAAFLTACLFIYAFFDAARDIWARQKAKISELENKLEPKLKLTFDKMDDGLVHLAPVDKIKFGGPGENLLMIRVFPTCESRVVHAVTGFLNRIDRLVGTDWVVTKYNEAIPLIWTGINNTLPIDIVPVKRQFLDVLCITDNKVGVCGVSIPRRAADELNFTDTFKLDVAVSSAAGDLKNISLRFKVGANWKSPEILEVMGQV